MANKNLTNAKRAKNDEFYTQYADIQKEIEAYVEYDSHASLVSGWSRFFMLRAIAGATCSNALEDRWG